MPKPRCNGTGPGGKVRGSLRVFHDSALWSFFEMVQSGPPMLIPDNLDEGRDCVKEATAILMRTAFWGDGTKRVIHDDGKNMIRIAFQVAEDEYGINEHIRGFVLCTLEYYNGEREIGLTLPHLGEEPHFGELRDAGQRQSENLRQLVAKKIIPVSMCIRQEQIPVNVDYVEQFQAIPFAITFVRRFMRMLFCEKLPKTLSVTVYEKAVQLGKSHHSMLEELYWHDRPRNLYRLVPRKKDSGFSSLKESCAVCLICAILFDKLLNAA